MDWLTFKYCVLIWTLYVAKSQSQLRNSTNTSNQLRSACLVGRPVVPPDRCNTCICFTGQVHCTNLPCPEKECINGMELPQPDECNKCICRRGIVTCSNMICIPAPHCTESQLYPAQNKCNACMCKKGFIICTSNVCAEEPVTTTITTRKPKKKKKCVEGSRLPGPNTCLVCICQNGSRRCKYVCNPIVECRFQGPECYPGQHIPRPDDCNNCICFEGQILCTHLPCGMDIRIGPEYSEHQPVYRLDECNECYCSEGRLQCSDLVCIRGSKCVMGQVIAKPDSCNACKCVEEHILCTNFQCPLTLSRNALLPGKSSKEVMLPEECQKGDYIPPPPPPNGCNTCYCMDNHIVCTMINCEDPIPEFKGRLKEINEKTNLEMFDKKIPVEPFINNLYTNNDKIPHKLIHSHTYNGFHQEIKVHAGHLPKDTTKLLNVLATSLDNAALASIIQRLTSNSVSNNQGSKKPFDHSVGQTNQPGERNELSAQSSKFITSGSQSNETILVIPHTKPFDVEDPQSVLPLESKHETTWKTVSAPATLVYNNGQRIILSDSQEENGNEYYYGSPPSMITSIDQNPIIRNTSKFGRPDQSHVSPIIHERDTADTQSIPTQSIYPTLHPKPININNGKMIYAPFSQDNKQIKPAPSSFVANRDGFQAIKSGPNHIFNHTSPIPVFRPGKSVLKPNNNLGQQKPSQYQFAPNPSNFYPNQGTPQEFQLKPKSIPSLPANNYNDKGVPLQPLYLNNPNQPIISANQYYPPQLKNTQFKPYPNNLHSNLPLINKRISIIDNEVSKEIPPHPKFEPNSTAHHSDILIPSHSEAHPKHTQQNSPQSQLIPNPSIYYKNEYEAPKIIEENPYQDQLTPNSIISYKHTEDYDTPHTSYESGNEELTPKIRNKTKKYNATHSHYEKHTSVTYVSEYDPNNPGDPTLVDYDLNEQHNGPPKDVIEHYFSENSQELDLSKKVDYYLNLPYLQLDQNEPHPKLIQHYLTPPGQRQNDTLQVHPKMTEINKYDHHDSWNITNKHFEEYPLSPSESKQTDITNQNGTYSVSPNIFAIYLHKPSKHQLVVPQDNSEKEGLNDLESAKGFQSPSSSAEDPTHEKGNDHLPPPSQTGPFQNQHTPEVFDVQGSNNGFQYSHNAYEDSRQFKLLHKLPAPKLETLQNHKLPGVFDDRGSADGVQYPSNFAEDLTDPKVKLNKFPHFDPYKSMSKTQPPENNQHILLTLTQNQQKPGNNRLVKDGFQYAQNANKDHRQLKPFHKLPPFPPGPTHDKQTLGMFDEPGSPDGSRYPSYLADNPIQSRGNLHNLPPNQFGPGKKRLPGIFDDRESADDFHYLSKSVGIFSFSKDKLNEFTIKYGPTQNQYLPGKFEQRGPDSFQYPFNSVENPTHPKHKLHNPPQSKFFPYHNQHTPLVIDDLGSADGHQQISNSTEDHKYSKEIIHKQPKSPFGPTQNQHMPGVFDNRGSAEGFQYPFHSAENPALLKRNKQILPNSPFSPTQNQHLPGMFDDRGSADVVQFPFHSAEKRLQPKDNHQNPSHPQLGPNQNQYMPGVFDDHGSADGFQYPSHSAENPLQPKGNQLNPSYPQLGPNQNQHKPGMFDDLGSTDGFQYPSYSAENPLQPKANQQNPSYPQLGPNQNQHKPVVFDKRGSADRFHYPSNSAEDPKHPNNNPDTTPEYNFTQSQNQPKPSSLDQNPKYIPKNYNDKTENQPTSNNYTNNNPVRPWMYLDHDQYKPSSFDNLLNGVHNIPWSLPEDHDKVVNTVTFSSLSRFESDYDQDNNTLGSNAELTTTHSVFKSELDQYEITDLFDEDDDDLQIEKHNSTDLIKSDSIQNDPNHRIKPDSVPGSLLSTDDDKIPDYYDQLYPLFKALKKLSEPSNDDSGLSSMNQLDLLPILFPGGIADILNYNPSQDQDDEASVETQVIQRIFPLKNPKSKLSQLLDNDNRMLNWLKSKLNKLTPTKDNTTETKSEIDLPKIFNLLYKLMLNKIKQSTENIPFNGLDPEIEEKIRHDFKEDTQIVAPTLHTDETTNDDENRFISAIEETQQQDPKKYPEVHIILHQPDDEDDVNLPPHIEADGKASLATDIGSEEIHSPMFTNMIHPRFRLRPKDLKDECGDGTQWISNCHSCSCHFGQTKCLRIHDCELKPFGEPMTCKPYSNFKMGCYTCECNGDGVAECDATECGKELKGMSKVSGSNELTLPISQEFFDRKKTNDILQYYKLYKKLAKDCPSQNSQAEYLTCEPGTSWVSSCHKCECNQRGKHECTKINDCVLDFDSYGKPVRCKPNSKFYPKTNSMPCVECSCNDEGISYCPEADLKKH